MGRPPDEVEDGPPKGTAEPAATNGPSSDDRVATGTPTTVDLAHPIIALIHELRPNIPLSVVASLVVECLDLSACMILDAQWAEARQRIWPEAIKAAHSRHVGQSYAERHRGYLEAS
jgi:hypothetical protein